MASDTIKMNGIIKDVISSDTFKVQLENNVEVIAHVSGKMRLHRIQILQGDSVQVEFSPYDLTRGRITYRN